MLLLLFTLALGNGNCGGHSQCRSLNKQNCNYPCYWQLPMPEAPKNATWFINPGKNGAFPHIDNSLDQICAATCTDCISTGRKQQAIWSGGKLFLTNGVYHYGANKTDYITAIECKAPVGCVSSSVFGQCKKISNQILCERSVFGCKWYGQDLFDMETGCTGSSNENAGLVFIIFAAAIIAVVSIIYMNEPIQAAVFENKTDTASIIIVQAMTFFGSCWGLYSALNIIATLSCLNAVIADATFTDCRSRLDDIQLGATLVLVGSIMALVTSFIIAFLHSFGLQELVDEEGMGQWAILEAIVLHFSKFFLFCGCIVGIKAATQKSFWDSSCKGEFAVAVSDQHERFISALLMAVFAIVFDILLCVKKACYSSSEEKDIESK